MASTRPGLVLELAREMAQALDDGWGIYGPLWPTFDGGGDENRPFISDPFLINYFVDGRNLFDFDMDMLLDFEEDADADGLVSPGETDPTVPNN